MRISKEALKTYIAMVIPLTLQNLVTSGVNMLDNLMIGRLGEVELAGVSMANKVFFIYNFMMFGVCSGAAIFFSQFWGKQDKKGIRSVMTVGITLCALLGAIFTLAAQLAPTGLMKILAGSNAEIIEGGARYLRVCSISYIFFGLTYIMGTALKAVERPRTPLTGSVVSLIVNGCLNYVFIFGKLGLPAMGIIGAALATLSARVVEFGVVLIGGRKHWKMFFAPVKEAFSFPEGFIKGYFRASLPVFFNESLWGMGVTVYGAVMARMGSGPAAAHSIVSTVENLLFALMFGTATAAGVLVGKDIGAGHKELAAQRGKFYQAVSCVQGIVIGTLLFVAAPFITGFFELIPDTRAMCVAMLRVCACFMFIKAYQVVAIVGTSRSAGDTIFCMICDVGGVWFIGVPLVILTGLVLKLPAPVVLGASYVEEAVKCAAVIIRQRGSGWIHDLVN
ncbi:MAG: MATE family efflux transporter [Clostridia bacterium]